MAEPPKFAYPAAGRHSILLAMPFLSMGGGEALISRLCRQLKNFGYRIFVITTHPLMDSQGDTTHWFSECATVHHLPQIVAPDEWPQFISQLIREQSIDIFWQVGSSYAYSILPDIRRKFPFLVVVDLLFNPVGHTKDFLLRQHDIDHVITEHDAMRSWLMDHGVPAEKVSVIPNGIDIEEFTPEKIHEKRREAGQPFLVAFLGRLSEEKGPDIFLKIAAALKDDPQFRFVMCGAGIMEDHLRAEAESLGLSDRLRFAGFVPTREALAEADAVVVCSRMDGRPNVVMESFAMGAPVVASRVGGIPEMTSGRGAILCDAGDMAAFADALRRLSEPATHREYAAAARRHALERFSITAGAAAYSKLFDELVVRHKTDASRPTVSADPSARTSRFGATALSGLRLLGILLSPSHLTANYRNARLLWRLRRAGFNPSADVDHKYYRAMYPDVAQSGVSPFFHYVFYGFCEGRNPSARFATRLYLEEHPELSDSKLNPLLHFIATTHHLD